jgi:L-galactose dehydrogenase
LEHWGEAGANLIETVLGKALKGISRDRYYLSTNVGKHTQPGGYGDDTLDYSRARIRASLDQSARRLGTDYFDIIHLHDFEYQHRRHTEWALSEGVEMSLELRKEGRIGNLSFGIYPMDLWHRIFDTLPADAGLVHNHYMLNDTRALGLLPAAKQKGIGTINGSPFGSGLLSGREALAWHPGHRGRPPLLPRSQSALRAARRSPEQTGAAVLQPKLRLPNHALQLLTFPVRPPQRAMAQGAF